MRKVVPTYHRRRAGWTAVVMVLALGGCAPALTPTPKPEEKPRLPAVATNLVPADWSVLSEAATFSRNVQMYKVKETITSTVGPYHAAVNAYGTVNLPDRAQFSIVAGGNAYSLYQQGQSAFQLFHGAWAPAAPLASVDLYASIASLITTAQKDHIPVFRAGSSYVVDEYCDVYQAQLPETLWSKLPEPPSRTNVPSDVHTGNVEVQFAVGRNDHCIREMSTVSVGSIPNRGPAEVETDVVFSALNSDDARLTIPATLAHALRS